MKHTLEGCDSAGELIKLGRFRKRGCMKRNRLTKFYKGKNSMKETGQERQISALAVGQLEYFMGVREVAVLPQQLLEQLLARFQHTLQRISANVMYAGFSSSFTLSTAYLTRNSGTMRIYL
jgi:hypothetical protein